MLRKVQMKSWVLLGRRRIRNRINTLSRCGVGWDKDRGDGERDGVREGGREGGDRTQSA